MGTRKKPVLKKVTLKQKKRRSSKWHEGAIYFSNSLCANELMTGETKGGYVSFPGPVSVVISPLFILQKSQNRTKSLKNDFSKIY